MKNYPKIFSLVIFATLLMAIQFGCTNKMSAQDPQDDISQGISGKVIWLQGNMMPMTGEKAKQPRAKGEPVQREVHIYELTNTAEVKGQEGFYSGLPTQLVKKVSSGQDGSFSVALEPGWYSVFVQEEQGLWANVFDGEGNIMPVEVTAGEVTPVKIEINYKAAY